jgi:hypothetical protein
MQATPIPDEAALPADLAERLRSLPPINIQRLLGNVPPAVIPWTDMTRAVYQCWIGITPRSQSWIRLGIRRGHPAVNPACHGQCRPSWTRPRRRR